MHCKHEKYMKTCKTIAWEVNTGRSYFFSERANDLKFFQSWFLTKLWCLLRIGPFLPTASCPACPNSWNPKQHVPKIPVVVPAQQTASLQLQARTLRNQRNQKVDLWMIKNYLLLRREISQRKRHLEREMDEDNWICFLRYNSKKVVFRNLITMNKCIFNLDLWQFGSLKVLHNIYVGSSVN